MTSEEAHSSKDELESMKYSELRKLAKKYGVKANMKAEKLVKAILDIQKPGGCHDDIIEDTHKIPDADIHNKRRGKTKQFSRKRTFSPKPGAELISHKRTKSADLKSSGNASASECSTTGAVVVPVIAEPENKKRFASKTSGEPARRKRKASSSPKLNRTFELDKENSEEPTRRKRKASSSPKLNRTFELDENSVDAKEPKAKKTKRESATEMKSERRRTRQSASPAVKNMLDSLKPGMSVDQMKSTLVAALDKNVEEKKEQVSTDHTNIPRFAAFLAKRKAAAANAKKPITPGNKDWEKIHQRAFSKLDSIDSYLEKRRKRVAYLTGSVSKTDTNTSEEKKNSSQSTRKSGARIVKPVKGQSQPVPAAFVPTVTSTAGVNFNFSSAAKKVPSAKKTRRTPGVTSAKPVKGKVQPGPAAFTPIVTSTANMNLNFTCTSTSKPKSLAKKPTRTPGNVVQLKAQNTSIAASPKRAVFDLKASLAKPLSWKPYTGKLQPLDKSKAGTQTPAVKTPGRGVKTPGKTERVPHQNLVKKKTNPPTKDDRRRAIQAGRANRKADNMLKRRGIVA